MTANARLPDYPDLPTFKEAGHPEMTTNTWFALSGAASLPDDLVQKINREAVRAMAQPQVQQTLRTQGFTTEDLSAAEFAGTGLIRDRAVEAGDRGRRLVGQQ